MEFKKIREEIEKDLEFFVWQSRFIKETYAQLQRHIALVSQTPEDKYVQNLRSYLEEIKNKFSRVNKTLIQINERTKEIEKTIQTELSHQSNTSDAENIKKYCEAFQTIQKHLHNNIESKDEKAFTALQSLLESLRFAAESTDTSSLISELTKTSKILRRITFLLRWYVLRAYRIILNRDFKQFEYLQNHVDHKDLQSISANNDSVLPLTNFFVDYCNTVFYDKNPQIQPKKLYVELRSVLTGQDGNGGYMSHNHSAQAHQKIELKLTAREVEFVQNEFSQLVQGRHISHQANQYIGYYKKVISDTFANNFMCSGEEPFYTWIRFVNQIKMSSTKSLQEIQSQFTHEQLHWSRQIVQAKHYVGHRQEHVAENILREILREISKDRKNHHINTLTTEEQHLIVHAIHQIISTIIQKVIANRIISFFEKK